MATVEIDAGVCGHMTTVRAIRGDGYLVNVTVESDCPHVRALDAELGSVDALQQIGLRQRIPSVLETACSRCSHAACPVPAGLVKAIEVAAGLALPRGVTMRISGD